MICYFLDRSMKILAHASTQLREGLHIKDDKKVEEIEVGQDIFSGYLGYGFGQRGLAEKALEVGNYILCHDEHTGKDEFYTVVETESEPTAGEVYFYAESAGLDLIGEICEPFVSTGKMTLADYIEKWTVDTGFLIGVNEAASEKKALAWDTAESAAERIISTAASFGCEVSYRFEVERFSVKKKYIDFYKKRGTVRTVTLRRGMDFEELRVKKSLAEIATSLRVTGGVPDGSGIRRASDDTYTWIKFSETYNGKDDGGESNMSDDATDMWYIGVASGKATEEESENPADYIWGPFRKSSMLIIKPSETGHKQWKKVNGSVRYTWIMFGTDEYGANISDQPTDRSYVGISTNRTSATKSTLASDYAWYPINSKLAHRDIFISPGTGGISEGGGLYTWMKFANDNKGTGMSDNPVGKNYVGLSFHRTTATESSSASDYLWYAIDLNTTDGGFVRASAAIPGIRQSNGKFTWIRFAKSILGDSVSSVPTDRPYIGLAYDKPTANANYAAGTYEWTLFGQDESEPVTLVGVDYDDGDIYVTTSGRVSSRKALAQYSRYLSPDESGTGAGHIVANFESNATDPQVLLQEAIAELKRRCVPEITYEIEIPQLPDGVRTGDTIRIADADGDLYMTARILKTEMSEEKGSCTVTLGDYAASKSGISDQIAKLARAQREAAKTGNYQWVVYADNPSGDGIRLEAEDAMYMGIAYNKVSPDPDLSDPYIYEWSRIIGEDGDDGNAILMVIKPSNGNVFKGGEGSTILTVHVYMGGGEVTGSDLEELGTINWYRDNQTDPIATGVTSITVTAADVTGTATYEARLEEPPAVEDEDTTTDDDT